MFAVLTVAVAVSTAAGQSIVSAKAGAVHHVEGEVLVDGDELVIENARFAQLEPGNMLTTGRGRAEVLLTPGVILRLAEDSSIRVDSNDLTDTRIEFLEGSALVEVMEILEDNAITFIVNNASIGLERAGLYRLDSDPLQFRVYNGKARVFKDDEELVAKKGRVVELDGVLVAGRFDAKNDDVLYRWSARRSGYLAMANLSAAHSYSRHGFSANRGRWVWNPYFGMLTFVPGYGVFSSPFGYSFWSPSRVNMVYRPRPVRNDGFASSRGVFSPSHGYSVVGSRSVSRGGVGGGSVSAGAPSASAPAPVTRGGGSAVGRGGSGGGRGR